MDKTPEQTAKAASSGSERARFSVPTLSVPTLSHGRISSSTTDSAHDRSFLPTTHMGHLGRGTHLPCMSDTTVMDGALVETTVRSAARGDEVAFARLVAQHHASMVRVAWVIADDPEVYFTTPHFEGFRAVLVRLERISTAELDEVVTDGWLARAPKRLAHAYLDRSG